MEKQKLIKKIKEIIYNYGSFSTADIFADCSPIIASIGKDTFQLAEKFYYDKIEAVTYVHETETNSEFIKYEDLRNDTLKQILKLAKEYEEHEKE